MDINLSFLFIFVIVGFYILHRDIKELKHRIFDLEDFRAENEYNYEEKGYDEYKDRK